MAGFECAIFELTGRRYNFDSKFQRFVEQKYELEFCTEHWSTILSRDRSDEEAFALFYSCWEEFHSSYPGFPSFDELLETMGRGNEVTFTYKTQRYYLLPHWVDHRIEGYEIGPVCRDGSICATKEDLAAYCLEGEHLIDTLSAWENIERVI